MADGRTIRSLGVERPGEPYFFGYEECAATNGEVQLDTLYSGFSAGTELTFFKNTNPYFSSRWDAENTVFLESEPGIHYPLPFLGYMEVARISASRAVGWRPGDIVAAAFGHKTGHIANPQRDMLVSLPETIDPILGIFVAQMGPIAANGILHADADMFGSSVTRLGCSVEGRPVLVWGGGVVGLLTALFAQGTGAAQVVVAEPSAFRRGKAANLGLLAFPEEEAWRYAKTHWHNGGDRGADFVFQTRPHPRSLNLALRALRPQGAVIDLAFYQHGADSLRLGNEFHHNGLSIKCAQIARVPRQLAFAWDRRRLAHETTKLLEHRGEAIAREMITHVVPLDDAPAFLKHLVADRPDFLQIVFKAAP